MKLFWNEENTLTVLCGQVVFVLPVDRETAAAALPIWRKAQHETASPEDRALADMVESLLRMVCLGAPIRIGHRYELAGRDDSRLRRGDSPTVRLGARHRRSRR
jgi:hypothetical protein